MVEIAPPPHAAQGIEGSEQGEKRGNQKKWCGSATRESGKPE